MAVRTFLPARRIATLGLGLFCFAQSGLVSCTNVTRSGGLMLRIDRDPELEMDAVSVSVTTDTRVLETEQYPLRSSKDFPATLGIATSGKDATIRLRLIALSKGTPVDVRDYKVEHIESSRIKLLEVYFSAACRPLVSIEDDEVTSTCSSGKTCDPETASCVSGTRDAVELPDYDGKDGGGEDGGDDGPDDTHPGTGGGGGMVEDELDPACSGRAAGDAYCAEDERYRCGDDLLLAQTTLDPCENGRCVEASGEAHCVSSCGFNNGGCADGIECIDTPEGARCAGCAEDEFSPSGDGTDCRPRVVCEPGTYVTDPGSASTDRKCAPCKKETFSSSVNQMSCAAWTVCTGNMVEAEKPSPTSDRRCVDSGRRFLSSGGKDTISSIAHAATGLLCVGGSTDGQFEGQENAGVMDAFIACFDAEGRLLWLDQFGTQGQDTVQKIIFDRRGDLLIVGSVGGELASELLGEKDAYVRKYSAGGRVLWTKQFGGRSADVANAVAVTSDDAIVVVGVQGNATIGPGATGDDASVLVLDDGGSELFKTTIATALEDKAYGVAADGRGGFYVVGATSGTLPGLPLRQGQSAFVRKYNRMGMGYAAGFTEQFGAGSASAAWAVAYDVLAERLGVFGNTNGAFGQNLTKGAGRELFVRSYKQDKEQFTVRLGSSDNDDAKDIAFDSEGNLVLVADVRGDVGAGYLGGIDVLLARLSPEGTLKGLATLGTDQDETVSGLVLLPEGVWLGLGTAGDFAGASGSKMKPAALAYLAPLPSD